FVALFVGWSLNKNEVLEELFAGSGKTKMLKPASTVWLFLVKFIAPVLIFLVFLSVTGVIK
ncbi:MAG: hypothetical protein K0B52_06280, partial [FCB group bacterium]|nr:hypothetical protein [FCB group bacterium]